jgi:hypothetical protein
MATQLVLPSPDYTITDAGTDDVGGTAGPGFASVKLSSNFNTMTDRTNSGRLLTRAAAYQLWSISIGYNPMTRAEFDPVYSFLMQRRGGLLPFFVELPQYKNPKNSTFATTIGTRTFTVSGGTRLAGSTSLTFTTPVTTPAYSVDTYGGPKPGDFFTLSSSVVSNLYKVYMVTTVTAVSHGFTLKFSPGLEKDITAPTAGTVTGKFKNILFRVVASKDIQEYSLNTENLYSFGLELEEALA